MCMNVVILHLDVHHLQLRKITDLENPVDSNVCKVCGHSLEFFSFSIRRVGQELILGFVSCKPIQKHTTVEN